MENEYKNESFQPEEITGEEPRGPQFDDRTASQLLSEKIAAAKNNGWGSSVTVFVEKNRATLLPLVALIASIGLGLGAIALLNDDQAPIQLTDTSIEEEVEETAETPSATRELPAASEEEEEKPTVGSADGQGVSVTASAGDGITHLARFVIAEELSASGTTLSAEQLVYAEDYLQNRTGDYGLEVGQEVSFEANDIADAISGAQNLTDWQLENLQQYTM
jgi:hypothetical protein